MKNRYGILYILLCVCMLAVSAFSVSANNIGNNNGAGNNSNGVIGDVYDGVTDGIDHFGDRITDNETNGGVSRDGNSTANNGVTEGNGNLAGDDNGVLNDDESDDGSFEASPRSRAADNNETSTAADDDGFNYAALIIGVLVAFAVVAVIVYLVAKKPVKTKK